jgi:diaminopimelate epimerase
VRFAKYHGIGNDFVVVDLRDAPAADAAKIQDPAVVKRVCDRRFGVGGDGVLAILPSTAADVRMRVLNADGSEAEMCGNGLRCVVKELHDRRGLAKPEIAVETGAGRLVCSVHVKGGLTESVTVAMGAPRLTRAEIPMHGPATERCIEQPIDVGTYPITAVSMGNPHAIAFVGSRDDAGRLAETVGPRTETHAWFPKRTNAEFAYIASPTAIDVAVWERGCGITLACGTGACATVVAAVLTGRCREGDEVAVALAGGTLAITVLPGFANVMMRGPAARVFDGELPL